MKVLIASLAAGLAFAGGEKLATKYASDRDLKYEIATSQNITSSTEGERDGEPFSAPAMTSEVEKTEVHVDHVVEATDGKPTKVRRTFEKVAGTVSMSMGENSQDSAMESPFNGITLEIVQGKDGLEVEVVEGGTPEGEGALTGHSIESFLDGLLPTEAVEVDASWDLDKTAISRALRHDVSKVLYPRPTGGGQGGEGGGRRRGGGGRSSGLLDDAEWKGTAKLVSADKEIEGIACSVIELKLTASGERDLPARQPRGGAFGVEPVLENKVSYDIALEGTFAFANKERRPVQLALEGTARSTTTMEFSNDERSSKSTTKTEGKIEIAVTVTEEKPKSEKTAKSEK